MVDVQSPTAEIRRGKKRNKKKKKKKKKQDENIMVCPITYRATITSNNCAMQENRCKTHSKCNNFPKHYDIIKEKIGD